MQVDDSGQKVRPLHKRSVVILREIPQDTTQKVSHNISTHSFSNIHKDETPNSGVVFTNRSTKMGETMNCSSMSKIIF